MKISSFSVILSFVVLMIIGAAMIPMVNVGEKPQPEQGRTLFITYGWPNMAAKVVEQNVTSQMEGIIASVKGVDKISSISYFGGCEIKVVMKKKVHPAAVKFEIASILRQTYDRLPNGVWYPWMGGGEMEHSHGSHNEQKLLLSYEIYAEMQPEQIKNVVDQIFVNKIRSQDDVNKVEVTGTREKYIEVNYNPQMLAVYNITPEEIGSGICNFIGKDKIVGDIVRTLPNQHKSIIPLHLTTDRFEHPLGEMPIKKVGDKIIYLNDLASFCYKYREPDSYYRKNGQNTINLNIYVAGDSQIIPTAAKLRKKIASLSDQHNCSIQVKLSKDASEQPRKELQKVVGRSLAAVFILLIFVLLTSRSWKCLGIVSITLLANILISIIGYVVLDIQLNVYSLAGITVAMGLIIDSVIVMTDHYSNYHNRKAFLAILAALLTTIGSLIVICFLPKEKQDMLYDFGWVIIINLITSLLVALLFVPALVEKFIYRPQPHGFDMQRSIVKWNRFYTNYICFICRHKVWTMILLVYAFGIPLFALPDKLGEYNSNDMIGDNPNLKWYQQLYNNTLGSNFYLQNCKDILSKYLGGSMFLFTQSRSDNVVDIDEEKKLHITGVLPTGSSAGQLNDKIIPIENYLRQLNGIKEFVTQIYGSNASIDINFEDEKKNGSLPYEIENKIVSKLIMIGGAEWKTSGVSPLGFTNSLNMEDRNSSIEICGYNYEQLNRYAENIANDIKNNNRIKDVVIETPGYERQEDEYFMEYNKSNMTIYHENASSLYSNIYPFFMERYVGMYQDGNQNLNIFLNPISNENYDFWYMNNAQINTIGKQVLLSDYVDINRRKAKNVVPRESQEFVLRVSFNVLGSGMFVSDFIGETIKHFNNVLPLGYKCFSFGYHHKANEQSKYWLILLIAVIIFFICSIQFDSLRIPVVVISMIPVSLIGTFLTFYISGVEFGDGGFASLIMLCGITVNAVLYIISQYQYLEKNNNKKERLSIYVYIRAFNHKIVPVLLTILSTILGLIPFFFDGRDEPFWFSFASGVTGGLLFSLIGLIFICPVFFFKGKVVERKRII